jgi:hypothetical protein
MSKKKEENCDLKMGLTTPTTTKNYDKKERKVC